MPEAKKIKKEIEEIVKPILNLSGKENFLQKLKVRVAIHENWYCKNGSVKRKDVANREKFLIDSVFEALDIDDKMIFEHTMSKVQSNEEFALIKIEVHNDNTR